jgi:hypothetical protein
MGLGDRSEPQPSIVESIGHAIHINVDKEHETSSLAH